MTYIMAVDDDVDVLETIGRVLAREDYDLRLVSSGAEALTWLSKRVPDLLILDIIMPEMDGITVCKTIRQSNSFAAIPILFLTARGTTDDIVNGLDAGGDDYVVKPFELAELRARVHALLRRGLREKTNGSQLQIGDLRLDSDTYQAIIDEEVIQLTSTEHRLLRYLMEYPNQAHGPSQLLQAVWEYPSDAGDPDLVRAHIRNLRAKLEKNTGKRYIRTLHGVGYMVSNGEDR